jgi:hypothetical protein
MACQYTYKGSTYEAWEFEDVLKAMSPSEASAFIPGVKSVPDAPFTQNTQGWLNLALKRVMKLAVDGGYDKVAFVNGEQSADRYSLSKSVAKVDWYKAQSEYGTRIVEIETTADDTAMLYVDDAGLIVRVGSRTAALKQLQGRQLDEALGKDFANKVLSEDDGSSSGDGLNIGGEGMKTFYNSIVPNAAKALLKKLGGGQMEFVKGMTADKQGWHITDPSNTTTGKWMLKSSDYNSKGLHFDTEAAAKEALAEKQVKLSQPGFTITDAMREKVGNGMPLFSMRDTQALDAEQAHQDDAPATPKARKYAGAKVDIQVKIEDTGEVATLRMDVHQTIDDFDSRQANMQTLLDCL